MRMRVFIVVFALSLIGLRAGERQILFNGSNLSAWEYRPGSWALDSDGSLTCRMEKVKDKQGRMRVRGMGYIWTKKEYGDFELSLSYKLSPGANSGVFYRADKDNPVQGGFEIQLMDNEGFQKTHGKKDPKKLNGSFYDAQAPSADPARPVGQWNTFKLTCKGPRIRLSINGVEVINVNVDDWDKPGLNPDGTKNKFKTALKDLPRKGRIGLQNHGQQVWFKDIVIRPL